VLTWVPSFKHRDHESHVALRISHAPQLGSFSLALLRIISLLLTNHALDLEAEGMASQICLVPVQEETGSDTSPPQRELEREVDP